MKKISERLWGIFLRYGILLLLVVPGLTIFYWIFMPLTVYPVVGFLSLFFDVGVIKNIIYLQGFSIGIIGACVAGAAYYFLLILNLSIPKIKIKKRLKMIFLSFGIFLIINLIRIILLTFIYMGIPSIYEFTHKLLWYLGSTIFVIGIWFFVVHVFNIKSIPFLEDLDFLYKKSNFYLKKKVRNKIKRK